ncbi:hypothetical protein SAMN04487910_3141 [Aquimarina amphilecti]|uniref:YHS domain-containing protein n=1 Tax=Aquimarina amphilecti TaxID=1038014 RepID=A0A1H7SHR2_AQUAM|nr:YHS domain-containing (seleno)protein [Aquimarina amphilecti]SEL71244.1 hypothetical protein SAMN04487910_3141 [Aquimarina amphilecti]
MIQNLKDGIAAQEYDVVSFFDKKPKKGKNSISSFYNEATYYFSTEDNKKRFEESPQSFAPQYGGFCAIAMSEDKQVNPNPKSWEIRDGKLYFFTRLFFGIIDAKRQWIKDPEAKRTLADAAYEKMNS